MLESLEFRKCLQILENGGDLALGQAIALQAQSAIKSDQRLTEIYQETRDFLSGAGIEGICKKRRTHPIWVGSLAQLLE